jgi:hypothetical protein
VSPIPPRRHSRRPPLSLPPSPLPPLRHRPLRRGRSRGRGSRRGRGRGRTAVGVVFARPTRAVIAPWSCRCRAVVVPLSRHRRANGCRRRRAACTTPRAACVVAWGSHRSGGGGLRSESTWGGASVVGVGGVGRSTVGGGHGGQRHTRLRKKRVWRRLNLRRGKLCLDTSTLQQVTSTLQASTTTERTEQLNWCVFSFLFFSFSSN